MWSSQKKEKEAKVHEIPQIGCDSQCGGWRPGGGRVEAGWRPGGGRVEEDLLSRSSKVTLQESTAANPEYFDFLCAWRQAAAGSTWVFFFFRLYCWRPWVGNQFTCPLLTFPLPLPPTQTCKTKPSVHTLIHTHTTWCKSVEVSTLFLFYLVLLHQGGNHPPGDPLNAPSIWWSLIKPIGRGSYSISCVSTWSTLKEMPLWIVIRRLGCPDDRHLGWGPVGGGGTFSPQQSPKRPHDTKTWSGSTWGSARFRRTQRESQKAKTHMCLRVSNKRNSQYLEDTTTTKTCFFLSMELEDWTYPGGEAVLALQQGVEKSWRGIVQLQRQAEVREFLRAQRAAAAGIKTVEHFF